MSEMRSFAGTQMVLSPRFSRIIPSLYLKFFIILPYINKTMDYAMVSYKKPLHIIGNNGILKKIHTESWE